MISSPVLPRCCVVTLLPLRSFDRVDAGVGQHDELEVLRIERRDVADLVVRLVERRLAGHGVDRRDRVAEAERRPCPPRCRAHWRCRRRASTGRRVPGIAFSHMSLSWPPSGIHDAALRAGHHPEVGGNGRRCGRKRKAHCQANSLPSRIHGVPLHMTGGSAPAAVLVTAPGDCILVKPVKEGYAAFPARHKPQGIGERRAALRRSVAAALVRSH